MTPRDIMDPNDSSKISGLKSIASRLGLSFRRAELSLALRWVFNSGLRVLDAHSHTEVSLRL